MNIKKIAMFKVKIDNVEVECVKLLQDENSKVHEKDHAIINILIQLKKFDRKLDELTGIIDECVEKAKECLKKKSRDVYIYMLL